MRIIMQSTRYLHFNQRDKGKVGDVSGSVTNSNTFFSSFEAIQLNKQPLANIVYSVMYEYK